MAKAVLHFSCSECGYSTGRWLGGVRVASFGTLAEEAPPGANGHAEAKPLLRWPTSSRRRGEIPTASQSSTACSAAAPVPGFARPGRR